MTNGGGGKNLKKSDENVNAERPLAISKLCEKMREKNVVSRQNILDCV